MYQKPDFVKISLKVKDVFANYTVTGCEPNPWISQSYTDTDLTTVCDGQESSATWVSLNMGASCYTTQNP